MGRNKRNTSPLAMVIRIVNAIILIIGYCVVIKGLSNGTLIKDLLYYCSTLYDCVTIIIQGT